MPFKKDGKYYIEYQVIPEREQQIRRLTPEQFLAYENTLKEQASKDPKELGENMILEIQKTLDAITAVKAG
jgi:hypothetical protein